MKIPLALALLGLSSAASAGSGWPQFRGEGGLGHGTGRPPVEFNADKNVKM